MISIGVITYNRRKLSKFCIDSIIKNTPKDYYELVVVDNNSIDGTEKFIVDYWKNDLIDKIIMNPENRGLGAAINQFWQVVHPYSDWRVVFSNDHFVMKHWLDNFNRCTEMSDPDFMYCIFPKGGFQTRISMSNKNGAKFLLWTDDGVGSGLALRKGIDYFMPEAKWGNGSRWMGSYFSMFRGYAISNNLKGVQMAKPCGLAQNCEFNNPEYRDYYNWSFESRGKLNRLDVLKRVGYTHDIGLEDAYYEGSDYDWKSQFKGLV